MVMARWPRPSSAPGSAAFCAIAAAIARGIEARAGADLVRRREVDDQHAHRTVALRLQDEPALELQRRAEHDRQHDRFAEQLGDRKRIIVAGQDRVDRGAEPHDAAAQIERLHFERQHRVVDRLGRRRTNRNGEVGINHRRNIGGDEKIVSPPPSLRGKRAFTPVFDGLWRRSNPESLPLTLDCFASLAMTASAQRYRPFARHQLRMPFCACRRFSASSNTTECGPSITSSVTSSPRCAGRQCMKMASGLAHAISRALT